MKKKLVQINTVCNASTGQIMHDIQAAAEKQGYETVSFVGRRKVYTDFKCEKFGNACSFWTHVILNTLFDCQGYGSYFTTGKLIRRLREEEPDIIHLHNLHGYYLNLPRLFHYLSYEFQGKVYWTFHDCWPFTGHCPYFVIADCDKWKEGCSRCTQKRQYPISFGMDASSANYKHKKEMFTAVKDITVITPSQWMKSLIEQSFFKDYRIQVVNNGIDLKVFHPYEEKKVQEIRKKYHLPAGQKILLGVAGVWEKRKGLDTLIELQGLLSADYVIVLAGVSRVQIRMLPAGMIGIERTENKEELAMLYSAAYIFLNPSMEESFSLVTVEAMACGVPVIVLDTSAVKELADEQSGVVLHENHPHAFASAIKKLEDAYPDRAKIAESAQKYGKERMVQEVLKLYEE